MDRITIKRCPCPYVNCGDYHLVGIGKFVQGSGFSKEEAEHIAKLLNENPVKYGTEPQTRSD